MPLTALQNRLQSIYEVDPGHRVEDYVITDPVLADRLDSSVNARATQEKLLIWQRGEDLRMSLYMDPEILASIKVHQSRPDARHLTAYCVAIEGVSHFMYLAWHARHGRNVTAMEMELQAEIDKFVTVLQRWGACADRQHALRKWLFDDVAYDEKLTMSERDRYQDANSYAGKYCRWLQHEYLHQHRHQELLNELRRFYRRSRADKLRHIDSNI